MDVEEVFSLLNLSALVSGVTLSGGEPFIQPRAAKWIIDRCHDLGKDVWVYTGFTWEELVQHPNPVIKEMLQSCDVLVDGPYIQVKRSMDLLFRGSQNQRIIKVKESLANNKLVLWSEDNPVKFSA